MFSDHQPYFTLSPKKAQLKFVKINTKSSEAINKFQDALKESDMINKIDNSPPADPNSNYSIIHKIRENAKNEHIPKRIVKFNKKKKAQKLRG